MTVRRAVVSRTLTEPSETDVSVPSQRSSVSHFVPRTVAALWHATSALRSEKQSRTAARIPVETPRTVLAYARELLCR